MATVEEHYANLLAPVYLWMAGGIDAALAQGAADVAELGPANPPGSVAVDLGAGFGMHAIPLARSGYAVTALDTSPTLLGDLRTYGRGLAVRAIEADLLNFRAHVTAPVALAVCMGDTITHLRTLAEVEQLCADVAAALVPGGRFVLTFRDYTHPASGTARFIPVRSDANRIHTCFLEEEPLHIVVHDVLHERDGAAWRMHVSSYRKLRLAPDWMLRTLERTGLAATLTQGPRGMLRISAARA